MCEGTVTGLAPGGVSSDEDGSGTEDEVLWRVAYDDGDHEDYDIADLINKVRD